MFSPAGCLRLFGDRRRPCLRPEAGAAALAHPSRAYILAGLFRPDRLPGTSGQTLDVGDQLHQSFFADLPLKSRHDVALEICDDLRIWIHDRFADVGVIGNHPAPVVQLHWVPIEIAQHRTTSLLIQQVATAAAELLEQLLALLGHRSADPAAG